MQGRLFGFYGRGRGYGGVIRDELPNSSDFRLLKHTLIKLHIAAILSLVNNTYNELTMNTQGDPCRAACVGDSWKPSASCHTKQNPTVRAVTVMRSASCSK